MSKLTLIYFEGCPNAEVAKEALSQYEFVSVRQDDLPAGHPHKEYSSPTILVDETPIIGTKLSGQGGGCSLGKLNLEDIKQKLAELE